MSPVLKPPQEKLHMQHRSILAHLCSLHWLVSAHFADCMPAAGYQTVSGDTPVLLFECVVANLQDHRQAPCSIIESFERTLSDIQAAHLQACPATCNVSSSIIFELVNSIQIVYQCACMKSLP